jgi:DNA modification methylase
LGGEQTVRIPLDQITIVDPSSAIDQEQLIGIRDSIQEIGLSHPLILRRANNSGEGYLLVAGEKRYLAAKELGWSDIEAEIREVDERQGKIIRLQENLKRFNLPWWEQVMLVEQLHQIRQQEHGIASRGRPQKGTEAQGWSIRDTAEELGVGVGPLSEDLSLARALKNNPTLAKVQDKKTAIRLMRVAADRYRTELDATAPKFGKLEDIRNQVYFGDSESVLKNLPDHSVDHCVTDPPWIKYFDAKLRIDERTTPVFKELYRVLKSGALLYLFCGLQDYAYYAGTDYPDPDSPNETLHRTGELERLGFTVSSTPIIWQKVHSLSRRGVRPWEYSRDFEFVIVACKGSATLVSSGQLSGIKTFKIVHPSAMVHPNEKPVELLEDIISDCSYEGNLIIDPFAGSGVVGSACKRKKRNYILIERDKKFYDQIVRRMDAKEVKS